MRRDNKFTLKGVIIWLICALFFLYEFLLRTVIGTFQHPIMYDLKLTSFTFAVLSSTVYLLSYGFMQIPVGLIVDRFGLKKSLLFACVTCTVATIGFAFSYHYPLAVFYRVLTAIGSSFGFVCLLVAVFDWLPNRNRGLLVGGSLFLGTMGPILAAGPINAFAEYFSLSWRTIYIYLGLCGALITLLILLLVENNKSKQGAYVILHRSVSLRANIKSLFSSIQPWYIAILSASLYCALEYLSEVEGKAFIELKGHSAYFAAYLISIGWIGFAFASPLTGYISDYFHKRKIFMVLVSLLYILGMAMITFSVAQTELMLGFLLLGVAAGGISISFANITEQFKHNLTATAFSLNNAIIMIAGAINAPLIGAVIDILNDEKGISVTNYQVAFSILIFSGILALVLSLFFIKESYCKSMVDFNYLKK